MNITNKQKLYTDFPRLYRDMKPHLPATGMAEYIAELAQQHGVVYIKTPTDELAGVFERLSDSEVEQDDTLDLLIALLRAGVIDKKDLGDLAHRYLRETVKPRKAHLSLSDQGELVAEIETGKRIVTADAIDMANELCFAGVTAESLTVTDWKTDPDHAPSSGQIIAIKFVLRKKEAETP